MRCIPIRKRQQGGIFMSTKKMSTQTMVMGAVLSALVIVLQYVSLAVKVGPVPLTLVLVPVIIGAATGGRAMGAWLGFVFGFAVLISGAGEPFFSFNPLGTIVTVFVKGTACGYFAGLVYQWLEKVNRYVAVAVASVVCPLVNTGVFFLGCWLFFMPKVAELAANAGLGDNVVLFMFVGLAGINFLVETGVNLVLNPIISRLLAIRNK